MSLRLLYFLQSLRRRYVTAGIDALLYCASQYGDDIATPVPVSLANTVLWLSIVRFQY